MAGELLLTSPLEECAFIRPRELAAMQAAGMASVRDLLFMLPRRYEDRRMFDRYDSLSSGAPVCLRGRVVDVGWKGWGGKGGKGRGRYVEAVLVDEQSLGQARFSCLWFSMPGVARMLCAGQEMIVYGRVKPYGKKLSIVHPDFEIIREGDDQSIHLNRIVPVYSGRMGIAVRRLREIVWEALARLSPAPEPEIYEFVPDIPCKTALRDLHFPETAEVRDRTRRRFALEECLAQQLNVAYRRRRADEVPGMQTAGSSHLVKDLADSLPFELTEAQKRCVREIYRDMKAPRSMNRLLQGDVGSGKTLVALCAMLLAVEHGYSAVMMAPTQILAEQHYLKFRQMLDKLDVPVSLVTADRKEESHVSFGKQGGIVVGTHALLYGKNVPERVGLVVIDEQHKFGVNQREKLIDREERPDVLVMTATPIPRTLTLTFYGELDVSILDGVPGGRGAVVTAIRAEKDQEKVLKFVRSQLEEGRQVYV
ncbi:DEAD/DEAH box helicase, partial [Akkermansia sp.]